MTGFAGAFMAWTFMMWGLLLLGKLIKRAAPATPRLAPMGRFVTHSVRPFRLPLLVTLLIGLAMALGAVAGGLYAYAVTSNSTCAQVQQPDGMVIFTCERGRPYHEQLADAGQS